MSPFKMKGFPMVSGTSPAKLAEVYEYLDDGTKKEISYEEGVKKANQNKHIRFTGKDLIKALKTNALDEFNHPSQKDEVRDMILDEERKLAGGLSQKEMDEGSKSENTINIKLND